MGLELGIFRGFGVFQGVWGLIGGFSGWGLCGDMASLRLDRVKLDLKLGW